MRRLTFYILYFTLCVALHAQPSFDSALQMLADFTPYLYNQYQEIGEKNSKGESLATFKGENTYGNNEQGVRHNADLSMICAFLCKYAKGKVTLPQQITWDRLQQMGRTTLTYAYSTHKANRLYPCKNNQYWGSVSNADHTWESSLWAMSVAYSAFFQWEQLSAEQRQYIYNLLKAECNYELQRTIPTNVKGDTNAEENGWECNVLAATLGLFPNDELAPQWFDRLRAFAINSYSHPSDHDNPKILDPDYDQKTIADLYVGANLYEDYTLQNHNYFHTSYQNVVAQELGESALALKLFQRELYEEEIWSTQTLMHNINAVNQQVLYNLALSDGELAMPNGNDWSLFLYDQITSYSTASCFLRDPDALMLEQQALRQIQRRQQTTPDGSWLLRPDVGARRMGVEAHRVMMTWLMHHILPTHDLQPTTWDEFLTHYAATKVYPQQDIITASSPHRFTCFSWSEGLKSYTGYFAPTNPEHNNIIVPFRANNTGNYIGWYEVEGKRTDAVDIRHSIAYTAGNSYVLTGTLETNEHSLQNDYMLFVSPTNLILYLDHITALQQANITKERGGLLAISTDPFTKEERTLTTDNGQWTTLRQAQGGTDNRQRTIINTPFINIDNCVGVIVRKNRPGTMAFGDQHNNNSILTSRLYAAYSDQPMEVQPGTDVDTRLIAYYSNVTTQQLSTLHTSLSTLKSLPKGWNGWKVSDTDGTTYAVIYNYTQRNNDAATIDKIRTRIQRNDQPKQLFILTDQGITIL